jgi:hypothetical protein
VRPTLDSLKHPIGTDWPRNALNAPHSRGDHDVSHEPPPPDASQAPYPIAEPPHPPQLAAANDAEPPELKARVEFVPNVDVDSRTIVSIGAAIALGAAATVAAVFFTRRGPRVAARKRVVPKSRPRKAPSKSKAA